MFTRKKNVKGLSFFVLSLFLFNTFFQWIVFWYWHGTGDVISLNPSTLDFNNGTNKLLGKFNNDKLSLKTLNNMAVVKSNSNKKKQDTSKTKIINKKRENIKITTVNSEPDNINSWYKHFHNDLNKDFLISGFGSKGNTDNENDWSVVYGLNDIAPISGDGTGKGNLSFANLDATHLWIGKMNLLISRLSPYILQKISLNNLDFKDKDDVTFSTLNDPNLKVTLSSASSYAHPDSIEELNNVDNLQTIKNWWFNSSSVSGYSRWNSDIADINKWTLSWPMAVFAPSLYSRARYWISPSGDYVLSANDRLVANIDQAITPNDLRKRASSFWWDPTTRLEAQRKIFETYFARPTYPYKGATFSGVNANAWEKGIKMYTFYKGGLNKDDSVLNFYSDYIVNKWIGLDKSYIALMYNPNYTTGISPIKKEIVINPKNLADLNKPYHFGVLFHPEQSQIGSSTIVSNQEVSNTTLNNIVINNKWGITSTAIRGKNDWTTSYFKDWDNSQWGRLSGFVFPKIISETTFKEECLGYNEEQVIPDSNNQKIYKGKTIYEILKGSKSKTEEVKEYRNCKIKVSPLASWELFDVLKKQANNKFNMGLKEDTIKDIELNFKYYAFDNYKIVPPWTDIDRSGFTWNKFVEINPSKMDINAKITTSKGVTNVSGVHFPIYQVSVSTAGDSCFTQLAAARKSSCYDEQNGRWIAGFWHFLIVKDGENLVNSLYEKEWTAYKSINNNELFLITPNYTPRFDNYILSPKLNYDVYAKNSPASDGRQYFNGLEHNIGLTEIVNGSMITTIKDLVGNDIQLNVPYIISPDYILKEAGGLKIEGKKINNWLSYIDMTESNFLTWFVWMVYNVVSKWKTPNDENLKKEFDENFTYSYNSSWLPFQVKNSTQWLGYKMFNNAGLFSFKMPTWFTRPKESWSQEQGEKFLYQGQLLTNRDQDIIGKHTFIGSLDWLSQNIISMIIRNQLKFSERRPESYVSLYEYDSDNYQANKGATPHSDNTLWYLVAGNKDIVYPFLFPIPWIETVPLDNGKIEKLKNIFTPWYNFYRLKTRANRLTNMWFYNNKHKTGKKNIWPLTIHLPNFGKDYIPINKSNIVGALLRNDNTVPKFSYNFRKIRWIAGEYYKNNVKIMLDGKPMSNGIIHTNVPTSTENFNDIKISQNVSFRPIGTSGNSNYKFFYSDVIDTIFKNILITNSGTIYEWKRVPIFKWSFNEFNNMASNLEANITIVNQENANAIQEQLLKENSLVTLPSGLSSPMTWWYNVKDIIGGFVWKLVDWKKPNMEGIRNYWLATLYQNLNTIDFPLGETSKGIVKVKYGNNIYDLNYSCKPYKFADVDTYLGRVIGVPWKNWIENRFVRYPVTIESLSTIKWDSSVVYECDFDNAKYVLFGDFQFPHYSGDTKNDLAYDVVHGAFRYIIRNEEMVDVPLSVLNSVLLRNWNLPPTKRKNDSYYLTSNIQKYFSYLTSDMSDASDNDNQFLYFSNYDTNIWNGVVYNNSYNFGWGESRVIRKLFTPAVIGEEISYNFLPLDQISKPKNVQQITNNDLKISLEGKYDSLEDKKDYYLSLLNMNNTMWLREIETKNNFYDYTNLFLDISDNDVNKFYTWKGEGLRLKTEFKESILTQLWNKFEKLRIESGLNTNIAWIASGFANNVKVKKLKDKSEHTFNDVLVTYVNLPNTKFDYDLLIPYGLFLSENEVMIDNKAKKVIRFNFIPIDIIPLMISDGRASILINEILGGNNMQWAEEYLSWKTFFHKLTNINSWKLSHIINYFTNPYYPSGAEHGSATDDNETDGDTTGSQDVSYNELNNENDKIKKRLDIQVFATNLINPRAVKTPNWKQFIIPPRDVIIDFLVNNPSNRSFIVKGDEGYEDLYVAFKANIPKLLSEIFNVQTKHNSKYLTTPESALWFLDLSVYKVKYDKEEIKAKTNAPYLYDDTFFEYEKVAEQSKDYKGLKVFKQFNDHFNCTEANCVTNINGRDQFSDTLFPADALSNNQNGEKVIEGLLGLKNLPEDMQPMVLHTKKIIPYTVPDYSPDNEDTTIKHFEDAKKKDNLLAYRTYHKPLGTDSAEFYYNQFNGVIVFWKWKAPKNDKAPELCKVGIAYANEQNPNTISQHVMNGKYTSFEETFWPTYSNGVTINGINFTWNIGNSSEMQGTLFNHQLKVFLLPESRDDCVVTLDHVLIAENNMVNSWKIWDGTPISNKKVQKLNTPIILRKNEIRTLPSFKTTIVSKKPSASIRITLYGTAPDKKKKYKEDVKTNTVNLNYRGKRDDIPWNNPPPNNPDNPLAPFKAWCGICSLEPVIPSATQSFGWNYSVDFKQGEDENNPIVQIVCNNASAKDITKIDYDMASTQNMVAFNENNFTRWSFNSLKWTITWLKKWQIVMWYWAEKNVDPSLLKRYLIEDESNDLKASVNGNYRVYYEDASIVDCNLNDITYNKEKPNKENTLQCYLTKNKDTKEIASFNFSKKETKWHMYFKLYKGKQEKTLFTDDDWKIRDIQTYRLSNEKMFTNPLNSSDLGAETSSKVKGYTLSNQSKMIAEYNQIAFLGNIKLPESVKPRFSDISSSSLFKGLKDQALIDGVIIDFKCKYDNTVRNTTMAYDNKSGSWATYGNTNHIGWYKWCDIDISVRFLQNPHWLNIGNSFRPNSLGYIYNNIVGRVPWDVSLLATIESWVWNAIGGFLIDDYKTSIPYTSLCSKNSGHKFCKYITSNEFSQKKHWYVLGVEAQATENDLSKNIYAFFDNIDSAHYKTSYKGVNELYANTAIKPFVEWWFPIEITKTVATTVSLKDQDKVINQDGSGNDVQSVEQIICEGTVIKEKAVYSYIDTSKKKLYKEYVHVGDCSPWTPKDLTYFKYINLEWFLPSYLNTSNWKNTVRNWKTKTRTCSCGKDCVTSWTTYYKDMKNKFWYSWTYIQPTTVNGWPSGWPKETVDEKGNPKFQNVLKFRGIQNTPKDNPAKSRFLIQVGNNNWTQLIGDFQINKITWRKDKVSWLLDTGNKLLKEGLGNFVLKENNNDLSYTGKKTKYENQFYIPLINCLPFDFNQNKFSTNINSQYKVDEKGQCPDGRKPLFYKILTDQWFNQKYIDEDILTKFNNTGVINFNKTKYETYIYNNRNNINNNKPFIGSPDTNNAWLKIDGLGAIFFSEKLKDFENDTLENTSRTKVYMTSNIEKKNPNYTILPNGLVDKKTVNGLVIVINGDLYIGKNVSLIEGILIVNGNVYVEDSQYQLNIHWKVYIAGDLVNNRKSVAYSEKDVLTGSYERPSIRIIDDPMWDMITDYPLINSILIDKETYKENEIG